jgi:hypothetical protein
MIVRLLSVTAYALALVACSPIPDLPGPLGIPGF